MEAFATKEVNTEFIAPEKTESPSIPRLPLKNITENEATESYISEYEEEEDPFYELKLRAVNREDLGKLEVETYKELLSSLKEEKQILISNGHPIESKIIDDACDYVLHSYENQMKKTAQKKAFRENKKRLREAESQYDECKEEYNKIEEQLIKRLRDKMKRVEEKHEKEINNYQKQWKSDKTIRKYSKTSQRLKELRLQARRLMNSSRYDEAREVTAIADRIQDQETQAMQKAMEHDYKQGLNTIIAQHRDELDTIRKSNDLEIRKLQTDKKADLEVHKKRIANIKSLTDSCRDEDKVWSKKRISYKPLNVVAPQVRSVPNTNRNCKTSLTTLRLRPIPSGRKSACTLGSLNYSELV